MQFDKNLMLKFCMKSFHVLAAPAQLCDDFMWLQQLTEVLVC